MPGRSWERAWVQLNLPARSSESASSLLDAFAQLSTTLLEEGAIREAFFMRKPPGLRLRWLPAGLTRPALLARVHDAFLPLVPGRARHRLAASAYEPEVYQFGGPRAMALVHTWFTKDSLLGLRHDALRASQQAQLSPSVLSLSVINDLVFATLGGAPEEAWDVWSNIARLHGFGETPRADAPRLPPIRVETLASQLDRQEASVLRAYRRANSRLAAGLQRLHAQGHLLWGMRALLPMIALFHWNRYALAMSDRAELCAGMVATLNPKAAPPASLPPR
jgi:thiopeptide-type bacteriocin biosynthesis protein